MARKGPIKNNIPAGDTKYNKVSISKFINSLMVDGKKSIAEAIFYDSLDIIPIKRECNKSFWVQDFDWKYEEFSFEYRMY